MRTLVFGVIYPGVELYLDDYFNSIYNQSTNDFDLLIIEDGIQLPKKYIKDNTIKKGMTNKTLAEIREYGIKYAKDNNYDIIVFTDTDDYFSLNRIENCILNINNNDFWVNALITFDTSSKESVRISIPDDLEFKQILDRNFFGLSNTAISTRVIYKNFYIPKDLVAVDWWIFSVLLMNGMKYQVDNNSITYYRQHSANAAGYTIRIPIEKIRNGIEIKLKHYVNLLNYNLKNKFSRYTTLIEEKIKEFQDLEIAMTDEKFAKYYCKKLNQNYHKIKNGWWSEIITLNELEKL